MEVIVGKLAGFCAGVHRAVENSNKVVEENGKVYCLGELVHNREVVNELESKGMVTIENIEEVEDNSIVIFRAHGVTKEIYDVAKKLLKDSYISCRC